MIEVNGKPVGQINYNDINSEGRWTELDIWMLSEAHCGQGHGPDAMETLCRHLREVFAIREFVVKPSASNARAIRGYEKAGFRRARHGEAEAAETYGSPDEFDTVYMVKTLN